jgi:hypothetical protein
VPFVIAQKLQSPDTILSDILLRNIAFFSPDSIPKEKNCPKQWKKQGHMDAVHK